AGGEGGESHPQHALGRSLAPGGSIAAHSPGQHRTRLAANHRYSRTARSRRLRPVSTARQLVLPSASDCFPSTSASAYIACAAVSSSSSPTISSIRRLTWTVTASRRAGGMLLQDPAAPSSRPAPTAIACASVSSSDEGSMLPAPSPAVRVNAASASTRRIAISASAARRSTAPLLAAQQGDQEHPGTEQQNDARRHFRIVEPTRKAAPPRRVRRQRAGIDGRRLEHALQRLLLVLVDHRLLVDRPFAKAVLVLGDGHDADR